MRTVSGDERNRSELVVPVASHQVTLRWPLPSGVTLTNKSRIRWTQDSVARYFGVTAIGEPDNHRRKGGADVRGVGRRGSGALMAKRRSMKRGIQRVDVDLYGDEFMDIVERYGDEAMFAAGQVVEREAKRRAARRTGNLVNSTYVGTRSKSTYRKRPYWRREKTPPKGGAVVNFTAPHAHLIESGRRKRGVIRPGRGSGRS